MSMRKGSTPPRSMSGSRPEELRATSERARSSLEALRAEFAQIPGTAVIIGQPISHRIDHMLSGTRANVAVKIFGPDLHELRRLAERARASMEGVDGRRRSHHRAAVRGPDDTSPASTERPSPATA